MFYGLLLVLGLLLLIHLIEPVLTALSLALVLTYLLNPLVNRINPYLKRRWISVTATFVFIMIPFFLFFVILSTTVVSQLIELSKTPQMRGLIDAFGENFKRYVSVSADGTVPSLSISTFTTLGGVLSKGLEGLIGFLKALGGIFTQVLLGIFLTVYLLFKTESIESVFDQIEDRKTKEFIAFIDEALKQVVYSMILTAAATGALAMATYSLFDVPFALLWGTATGIVALIPLLGTWLIYLPITGYFLIQGKIFLASSFLFASVIFITVLPDLAVRPLIAGKKVDVELVVFGFITGSIVFGAAGFILGPLIIIAWTGFVKIFLMKERGK